MLLDPLARAFKSLALTINGSLRATNTQSIEDLVAAGQVATRFDARVDNCLIGDLYPIINRAGLESGHVGGRDSATALEDMGIPF